MRSSISHRHNHLLLRAAAIALLGGLAAGCSSDASRFSERLLTASTLTPNQQAILRRQGPVSQAYPGDVAPIGRGSPIAAAPLPPIKPVVRSTLPAVAAQPKAKAVSTVSRFKQRADRSVREVRATGSTIVETPRAAAPLVLKKLPSKPAPLKIVGVDKTTTASVSAPADAKPAPVISEAPKTLASVAPSRKNAGWTKTGGTWVSLGEGETLYNLSRRYGVPVSAITKANKIADSNSVAAGTKILIPTYNFAQTAPVSAPDNDPETRASRSTTGYQGQLANARVPLPSYRSPSASVATVDKTTTGSVPKTTAVPKRVEPVREPKQVVAKAEPQQAVKGGFAWPVRGGVIGRFGESKGGRTNDGIDIAAPEGTPIRASRSGTVIYSGAELEQFGDLVLLSHSGGWVTAYANASKRLVKRGDKVKAGQVIAKSGSTGRATKPQVHFELRKNSKPVDPLKHLPRG